MFVRSPPPARVFPWVTTVVCVLLAVPLLLAESGWALPTVTGQGPVELSDPLHIVGLGARSTPLVADAGEAWRLLTCHFVHTSLLHLAFNLLFLFMVGAALEQVVRRSDYGAVLLFSAGVSAAVSLLGTPQVSAGASGIVFGVLGAAVTFGLRRRDRLGPKVRRHFGWAALPFVAILFAIGLGNPAVDQASHAGGLLAGMGAGWVLELRIDQRSPGTRPYPLGFAIAAVALILLCAPLLARGGKPPQRVVIDSGASLEVPGTWHPRYGQLGELEFYTAGGMVVLTTDRVPNPQQDDPWAWYESNRLRPLTPAGQSVEYREDTARSLQFQGWNVLRVRIRLRRWDTPMVRDVYFLRDVRGRAPTSVLAFETPATWAAKYEPVRSAVASSVRPPSGPDDIPVDPNRMDGPPISVAALQ